MHSKLEHNVTLPASAPGFNKGAQIHLQTLPSTFCKGKYNPYNKGKGTENTIFNRKTNQIATNSNFKHVLDIELPLTCTVLAAFPTKRVTNCALNKQLQL